MAHGPGPSLVGGTKGSHIVLRCPRLRSALGGGTLGRRIEAWLKRQALEVLARETAEFAFLAGVAVSKVRKLLTTGAVTSGSFANESARMSAPWSP